MANNFVTEQGMCEYFSDSNVTRDTGQNYCEPSFDSLLCWIATPVNTQHSQRCPIPGAPEDTLAYKNCSSDGIWSLTDYEACLAYLNNITTNKTIHHHLGHVPFDEYEVLVVRVMTDIYFIFSIISLLFLLISIFIFIYFRSLHCHRITIHIHMFISFVIKYVILIVMVEPGVFKRTGSTYKDVGWLCKTLLALSNYANTSNMYWMFVEGLYLHNQIASAVFSTEAPFKLFCFIGWGVPGIIVVAWSIIMQVTYDKPCWQSYSQSPWVYLVIVPFLLVIFINLVFLINIIRILVTKLRSNNTDESSRIKKTIRATIILMPLLGLTNVLFLVNPEDRASFQLAYHITNAILQSTGGILLSVLYCFMNGEVQRVIKQKWTRFNVRRHLKRGGKSRSSRNSSFMLSQTEGTDTTTDHTMQTMFGNTLPSDPHSSVLVNNNRYHKVDTVIPEEELIDSRDYGSEDNHKENGDLNSKEKHVENGDIAYTIPPCEQFDKLQESNI